MLLTSPSEQWKPHEAAEAISAGLPARAARAPGRGAAARAARARARRRRRGAPRRGRGPAAGDGRHRDLRARAAAAGPPDARERRDLLEPPADRGSPQLPARARQPARRGGAVRDRSPRRSPAARATAWRCSRRPGATAPRRCGRRCGRCARAAAATLGERDRRRARAISCPGSRPSAPQAGGRGIAELLERAIAQRGYEDYVLGLDWAERRLANVHKLLRLARRFEEQEGRDLRAFVDLVARPQRPRGERARGAGRRRRARHGAADDDPHREGARVPRGVRGGPRPATAQPRRSAVRRRRAGRAAAAPPGRGRGREDARLRGAAGRAAGPRTRGGGPGLLRGADPRPRAPAAQRRRGLRELARGETRHAAGQLARAGAVPAGCPSSRRVLRRRVSASPGQGRRSRAAADAEHARGLRADPARPPPAAARLAGAARRRSDGRRRIAPEPRARPRRAGPAGRRCRRRSATRSLSLLERCGYRYYLERVLRMPEERRAEAAPPAGGLPARERGTLAHRVLETFDFGAPAPPGAERVATVAGELGLRVGARGASRRSRRCSPARSRARWPHGSPPRRAMRREHPFAFGIGPHAPARHGRDRRAVRGGRRDVARRRLQERPARARRRARASSSSATTPCSACSTPSPCCARARSSSRSSHWFLERPLEPAVARYTVAERAALEAELAERLSADWRDPFTVSPNAPSRPVPHLSRPRRHVLLGRGGDDARGALRGARKPVLKRDARAKNWATAPISGRSALIPFLLRLRCPPARTRRRRHDVREAPTPEHSHVHAQHPKAARGRRPLRPPLRARRVRRRDGGAPGQRAHARGHHQGDHRAREPRASRCLRSRSDDRRRRRDPDADARRAAAGSLRVRAAAARLLRSADVLPAHRSGAARRARSAARADRGGRGPGAARLARGPGRAGAHGPGGRRLPAGDPPAVRRRRRGAPR